MRDDEHEALLRLLICVLVLEATTARVAFDQNTSS